MIYEEAIKWIGIELEQWEAECKSIHPTKDALRVAIKAIEKQIPKKPIAEHCKEEIRYICPNCGDSWNENEYELDFCWECGQAIDWSDEE